MIVILCCKFGTPGPLAFAFVRVTRQRFLEIEIVIGDV